VYFLLAPFATTREVEDAAKAGHDLPLNPKRVLRISVDGKKRTSFDPASSPKLADATTLKTLSMALDQHGALQLLVWATWAGVGGKPEKGGQYLVAFSNKGEYRSQVEIDWQQILVYQFEIFGSGDVLLRGRRTHTAEPRIAILSGGGSDLKDVVGWAGYPSQALDDVAPPPINPRFNYMVRGSDGRIYVAEQDAQQDRVVVYSFGPFGDTDAVLKLRPTPKDYQLVGLKAAPGTLAAIYLERDQQQEGSPGELKGRLWIDVYNNTPGGDVQSTYGPVQAQPSCYQRIDSQDRFTFLIEGDKLVTMGP
jgi:hypothetical protein